MGLRSLGRADWLSERIVATVTDPSNGMKHSLFTDEQIIGILKKQESGLRTADVCRKRGISEAAFYKYTARYQPRPDVRKT